MDEERSTEGKIIATTMMNAQDLIHALRKNLSLIISNPLFARSVLFLLCPFQQPSRQAFPVHPLLEDPIPIHPHNLNQHIRTSPYK